MVAHGNSLTPFRKKKEKKRLIFPKDEVEDTHHGAGPLKNMVAPHHMPSHTEKEMGHEDSLSGLLFALHV